MKTVRQKIIYMLIIMIFFFTPLSSGASFKESDQALMQNGVLNENWAKADKAENKEAAAVNNTAAVNMPYIADAKSLECTKETIKGLKTLGYSLGEIVKNLVKSGNKAQVISMALLSTGDYSGQVIYNALINEGKFPHKEAEAAVPSGIRNEGQLLGPLMEQEDKAKTEQVAEKVRIKNNPLSTGAVFSEERKENFEAAIVRAIDVTSVRPGTTVRSVTVAAVKDGANGRLSPGARVKQGLSSSKPTNKFKTNSSTPPQRQKIAADMKSEGYTAGQIAQGFYANGISLTEIASAFKEQGISSEDTYKALMSVEIKNNPAQVVTIMHDAGFEIIPALNAIVNDFKGAGVSSGEVKSFLFSYIPHEQPSRKGRPFFKFWRKRTEPAIKGFGEGEVKLAQAMMRAGYSREQISTAFENITEYKSNKTYYGRYSYSKEAVSGILNQAAANIVNEGGKPDVKTLSILLGAEYSIEDIKSMFSSKGIAPEEVVEAINSSLGELTCNLHDKGKSAAVIARVLLGGNTGDRNNVSVVAENLARSGVSRGEILTGLTPYAKAKTDILNGITTVQNEWKGKTAAALAQGFYNKGYTLEQVAAILLEARVNTESAYKALKGVKEKDGTVAERSEREITNIVLSGGYQKSNVYLAAINGLKKQGITYAKDIVRELVGVIDTNVSGNTFLSFFKKNKEENIQKAINEKMPDAQLAAVCMINQGYSAEEVKNAFLSNGFTSESAARIVNYAAANAQPVKGGKTQEEILRRDIHTNVI